MSERKASTSSGEKSPSHSAVSTRNQHTMEQKRSTGRPMPAEEAKVSSAFMACAWCGREEGRREKERGSNETRGGRVGSSSTIEEGSELDLALESVESGSRCLVLVVRACIDVDGSGDSNERGSGVVREAPTTTGDSCNCFLVLVQACFVLVGERGRGAEEGLEGLD